MGMHEVMQGALTTPYCTCYDKGRGTKTKEEDTMKLSATVLKALRAYPERFEEDTLQADAPDGSKYALYTRVYDADPECECASGNVFTITADDAASFHEAVEDMGHCDSCGSWFQG